MHAVDLSTVGVYIASSYDRRDEMRSVALDLLMSHQRIYVTSRWLTTDPLNDLHKPFSELTPDEMRQIALRDLVDIDRAQVLLAYTGTGGTGGRHVEFGYAFAKTKRIGVIGPCDNVFYAHPALTVFAQDTPTAEIADWIKTTYLG